MTVTESVPYRTTSYATTTTTTTGYATTQVSSITHSNTLYITQIQISYGTATVTTYIYVESYLSSSQSTNVTSASTSSNATPLITFPQLPLSGLNVSTVEVLAGGGAVAGSAALMMLRRRRLGSGPGQHSNEVESDDAQDNRIVDYIASHNGSIMMSQATADLGMSASDLTRSLQKLKAQGKLNPA
jgi:hypothetical protein